MMLDTNGELFPEGTYTFRVAEVPEQVEIKNYIAWQFVFDPNTDEGPVYYRERFMVWLLAPLLRGLGFPEEKPGKFDFEPTQALNREVTATIKHVTLEKSGKTVARMTDIRPVADASRVSANRGAFLAQAPKAKQEDEIPF